MSNIFVVKNQDGYFISKQKEWITGRETRALFRSIHKDEALNMVFELSSKDINLRAEAISVEMDDNKLPVVEVTAPEPEPSLELSSELEETTATEETLDQEPTPEETPELAS